MRKDNRLAAAAVCYLGVFAVLAWGYAADESTCVWRALTGHRCPGCGMTHALLAMAQCHWRAAWDFNPASYGVAPILAWTGVCKLKRSRE